MPMPERRGIHVRPWGLRLAAIAAAVLGILTVSYGGANAASLPTLYASDDGFAHECSDIGFHGNYKATVCADIKTYVEDGTSGYFAQAEAEVFCSQDVSGTWVIKGCQTAAARFGLFGGSPGASIDGGAIEKQCSYEVGATCAGDNQRNYWYNTAKHYSATDGTTCTNPDHATQAWTDVLTAGATLPDGAFVGMTAGNDGSHQISGHNFICE
jgi:hypothetical protein